MSGDKIDLFVQSYYSTGTTSPPNDSKTDVLASLASGIVNIASGGKGSISDLNNTGASPIYAALNSFLPNDDPTRVGKPKAYLNWILLDDQLKYVSSYPQSGAIAIGASGVINILSNTGIPITKNGFLYIWVSNETPNWYVYFDNLKVVQYAGPLLEETHYYPFGLTMAAISSKALKPFYTENKYRYNGKELQNKEFSDGTGLEEYDYHARMYDPQIGRWIKTDGKAELYFGTSPYVYALDQPSNAIDPDGKLVIFISGMNKGDGNSPEYWRLYEQVQTGYHNDHDDNHNWSGPIYDKVEVRAFEKEVMDHLGDHNALYRDGSSGGIKGIFTSNNTSAFSRFENGKSQGEIDAKFIIENLARDKNGNIVESIKVISHSMGAAYAKGYIQAILDYVKEHNIIGVVIAFEADFAPYQPNKQIAVKGKNMGATLQYSHNDDNVAGDDPETGAIKMDTSKDEKQDHSIFTFSLDDILSLPVGSYKIVNGKIVAQ